MGADQFFLGPRLPRGGAISRHEPHVQYVFLGEGGGGGVRGGSKAGSNNCLKVVPQMSQVLLVRFLKSYLNPELSFVKSSTKEAASGLTETGAFAVLSSSLVKRQ